MKVGMEGGFEWPAAYCNVFIADAFTLQSIAHKVHSVLSCRNRLHPSVLYRKPF